MNGCRWQEKSFNVVVNEDKLLDICKCGKEITGIKRKYNGDTLCKECFDKQPTLRQRLGIIDFSFNTPKDKLYDFIDTKNFSQPTEVRGKGHWKRLLKQHGLIDDVDLKKPNELKSPTEDYKPMDRRFIRDEILRELQDKGLRHKLIRRK